MGETRFYDRRVEEEELVQLSIMVKKKDEELIKSIFRNLRNEQENQTELAYLGRCATDSLIEFARELAKANGIPEPEHFYDYHISLGGWILNVITHSGSRYKIILTEVNKEKVWKPIVKEENNPASIDNAGLLNKASDNQKRSGEQLFKKGSAPVNGINKRENIKYRGNSTKFQKGSTELLNKYPDNKRPRGNPLFKNRGE